MTIPTIKNNHYLHKIRFWRHWKIWIITTWQVTLTVNLKPDQLSLKMASSMLHNTKTSTMALGLADKAVKDQLPLAYFHLLVIVPIGWPTKQSINRPLLVLKVIQPLDWLMVVKIITIDSRMNLVGTRMTTSGPRKCCLIDKVWEPMSEIIYLENDLNTTTKIEIKISN